MTTDRPVSHKNYSVPYLDFDAQIIDVDVFGTEFNPQSGLMIGLKSALGEPKKQAAFAYTFAKPSVT